MAKKNHSLNLEGVSFTSISQERFHEILNEYEKLVEMDIDHVGKRTAAKLIKEFGDVESIREASIEDVRKVDRIGKVNGNAIAERLLKD